jgi:3-methyl-2-oxobutanoate hydroxymethyltransferase
MSCLGSMLSGNMVMRCRGVLKHASSNNYNLVRSNACRGQSRTMAKVSALSLNAKKRKGKKITMVTAYDFPSSVHVARAGIDIILVGDSVAMVELGHATTQQMSADSMIHHCESVKRGLELVNSGSMLVGDMPFGTYEFEDTDVALRNAYRFVKEGGCDAVKLEVRFHISNSIGG